MKSTVLLIDDDPLDLKALQLLVAEWGLEVVTADSGDEALAIMAASPVDAVISDVRMPGMSGEGVVRAVSERDPGLPVVLITGRGDIRSAVAAMKLGAFDYVVKPPDEEELRLTVVRALEHGRLHRENAFLRAEMASRGMYGERLIGRSSAMLALFDLMHRVARSESTILITGETGTGKELVAQTLHYQSARAGGPLVAVNCAALQANLIENELFGHEKGAFTGAVTRQRGRFEEADGGTLLLDEIGETSPAFQAKLLRVLQEGTCERVGGTRPIHVDVRVLASTNRDLAEEVRAGRFREDLFYRLSVIPVAVPALRDRRDDIPLLAGHFVSLYGERYGVSGIRLSDEALEHLVSRDWPGNVRELQHAIERAVVLARAEVLMPADFSGPRMGGGTGAASTERPVLHAFLDARMREYVLEVLDEVGWRKGRAAALLGVDRATLYRTLKRLRITAPEAGGAGAT